MAVSISEKPYLIDFVHNSLIYKLIGTPILQAGRKAVSKWKIAQMPRLDYSLVLSYGDKVFTFQIKNLAIANNTPHYIGITTNMSKELIKKIAENYYISKDFEVSISEDLEMIFTSRTLGAPNVTLSTTDPQAILTNVSHVAGIEKIDKKNYKVFARFEITRYVNGTVQQSFTPEILLTPDTDNKVFLYLNILRPYFSQIDIPLIDELFGGTVLQYATLKYRLIFSDYFDDKVQVLKYSDYAFVVAGKLSEMQRSLNLPDWATQMNGNNKLSHLPTPINYGCDTDLTVKTFAQMPQYVYFMLFNINKNGNYSSQLAFRVDILNSDGSRIDDIELPTLEVSNYNIIRVAVSCGALRLDEYSSDILSYTVRAFYPATRQQQWKRTFILKEKPYHAKTFLLQNRYGVLETFSIDHEAKEKTVEGEQIKKNTNIEIDISDISEIYTARTGYKSPAEMKLLAEALESSLNFKIENREIIPITILPNTLSIYDEAEDLQNAEFQYKYNIAENIAGEKTGRGINIALPYREQWVETYEISEGKTASCVWVDNTVYNREQTVNAISLSTPALKAVLEEK